MLRSILIAVTTVAMSTAAQAGGVPTAPQPPVMIPPAAPVETWTGFYGGVQLEYGRGDIDYGTVPGAAFPDGDIDGHLYGIFVGYRVDYGNIVFGTEFDYMAGSLDSDTPGIDSIDSVMRATLELGVDTGNSFIYGTAGVHGTTVDTTIAMDDMDWGPVYGIGMGLSYDFPRLPCDKGAAARHPKYAGQRRGTDREWVGRCGPCGSVIAPVFSHDLNG